MKIIKNVFFLGLILFVSVVLIRNYQSLSQFKIESMHVKKSNQNLLNLRNKIGSYVQATSGDEEKRFVFTELKKKICAEGWGLCMFNDTNCNYF